MVSTSARAIRRRKGGGTEKIRPGVATDSVPAAGEAVERETEEA